MDKLLKRISPNIAFSGFAVLTLLSIIAAALTSNYYLFALPFVVLGAIFLLLYLEKAYFLLFLALPLSIEFEVGSSLATDLPTEPLMVALMFVTIAFYLVNPHRLARGFINHPIITLLGVHVLWTLVAVVFSTDLLVSFKFFLAKMWYVVTFVFLSALLIKDDKDFRPIFLAMLVPLFFVVIQTVVRHYYMDFGFREANHTMTPFFRNHVNYAVMLAMLFPFLLNARHWYKKGSLERLFIHLCIFVFLVGIWFAYTRAAYVSILLIPILGYVFKRRWIKQGMVLAVVVMGLFIGWLVRDYNYMAFAPDYEHTVYHDDLGDHISATFEGKDVSSMERVYRWVAAAHMCTAHPLSGFGPGNFYNNYRPYTVDAFETYVSNNVERSGVHNYYLMILVEQGFVGLLIFIVLLIVLFWKGEEIYHALRDEDDRKLMLAILIAQAMLVINLLISDMIETDKIGSLFFLNIAIMVNLHLKTQRENELLKEGAAETTDTDIKEA